MKFPTVDYAPLVSRPTVVVKVGSTKHRLLVGDIHYVEADHVYVKIHYGDGRSLLVRESLSGLASRLPRGAFARVHRGFLVNLSGVSSWSGRELRIAGRIIPIGRSKRKTVLAQLART